MVKADPGLAWIKEAEQRGDVDWRQVKEVHDSFKYSQSGTHFTAPLIGATGLVFGANCRALNEIIFYSGDCRFRNLQLT